MEHSDQFDPICDNFYNKLTAIYKKSQFPAANQNFNSNYKC